MNGNFSRELSWTMCRLLVASGATGNRGNQHAHPRAALRWRRGAGAQVPRPTSASSRWCSIETTIDPTQRLLVGVWRLYRDEPGQAHPAFLVEEGILIPDDLDVTDPEGHALVCAYVASHRSSATRRAFGRLRLLTRSQFVEQLLWRRAYKQRSLVVGFNLAIDLSRLASRCRAAKAGFVALLPAALRPTGDRETLPTTSADGMVVPSLRFAFSRPWQRPSTKYRRFPGRAPNPRYAFRGVFLDLRTLAFALTNGHSLESASAASESPT